MSDKERAARLLKHYFRMVWERAGLGGSGDNEAELNDLAELLTRPLAAEEAAQRRAYEREDGQVTEWCEDIGGHVTH